MIRLNNNRQRRVKEAEARARRGRGQAKRAHVKRAAKHQPTICTHEMSYAYTASLIVITQLASAFNFCVRVHSQQL